MKKKFAAVSTLLMLSLLVIFLCACGVKNGTASSMKGNDSPSCMIVLVYHGITNEEVASMPTLITQKEFKQQMQYLYENAYHALSLEDFQECHEKGKFPKKSILITFDDGYKNFMEFAYPVLKEYSFHSVLFPIVGYTPGLEKGEVWNPHLSFHDLRLMDDESGLIDIGSHTYDLHYYAEDGKAAINRGNEENYATHKARIKRDLYISKEILELQTDKKITALAWPYGVANQTAVNLAEKMGYQMLFTLIREPVFPETPLSRIPRYAVLSGSMEQFQEILANT